MWRYCALSVLLVGCCKNCGDQTTTRFYEDGRAKPVVVLAPVVDTTSSDLGWSLSEEFTSLITRRINAGSSVVVLSGDEYGYTENPFGEELSWMKREFSEKEFVAFLELVEHEIAPAKGTVIVPFETPMNLKMAVRLRLVDLRGTEPKIVLQELVKDSFYIPRTEIPIDYKLAIWGTGEYNDSPMRTAHEEIVEEISKRIKDYLFLAKSR